ncbi:MAG TPA: hypothetical protein VEH49_10525 [Methylomirabilota bacterium]|nr:hypothetical protein [Methylomirabilota bacterium]
MTARARQNIGCLALLLPLAAVLCACSSPPPAPKNNAHGSVSNVRVTGEAQLINGEMDWGELVTFDLVNTGERGMLHITVVLSTSEGQWTRTQDLEFGAQESRTLSYFFQEPTINVTNVQARVSAEP